MSMSIPEMLKKLDEMYSKEEHLKQIMIKSKREYDQLQEDKVLLQQAIMHQSNKNARFNK